MAARRTREDQPLQRTCASYHPWRRNGGGYVGDAADQVRLVVGGAQIGVLQNAILKRDQRRVIPDERPQLLQRRLRVPQLHAHHHQVDGTELTWVVRGTNVLEMKRVRAALDPKPVAAHRVKVRTARDENDVGAAPGQQRAEIAAKPSRSHHSDPHLRVSKHALTRRQVRHDDHSPGRSCLRRGTSTS